MTRTALAAMVLAAGCASAPPADPAPLPAGYEVEVRFERSDGAVVLAPHLRVYSGQRGTVQVTRPVSYVRSFEVKREGTSWIVDPIVGTVSGGVLLEATTAPLADGSGARFAYRIETMDPGKEMPERRIPLGNLTPMALQMPEVSKASVEGAALLRHDEESAVAVLPWPGEEGGLVTVRVTVRAAEPADLVPDPESPPVLAAAVEAPGWFRLRSVRLSGDYEPGAVVEGDALRGLMEGGAVAVDGELQWAGAADAPRGASVLVERPYIADWDVEGLPDRTGPVIRNFTAGLLADPSPEGGFLCTLSSLLSLDSFSTGGNFPPVSIDVPRIHVDRGSLPSGPGERLLVLGPRKDGGCDGVLLSFRPGATGPAE